MYTIEVSWGANRETVCPPIIEETSLTSQRLIDILQTMWNANTTTYNFSAKITKDNKIIYDDRINQHVIDGFRYQLLKELLSNG